MSAILSALSSLDLSGSLGAIENGTLLGVFLFGIETLQTFHYYRHFPQDSNRLKAVVGFVWVLELGHTISTWHTLYSQTVAFYGRPGEILSPPLSEEITIIFAALVYTVVQFFFANRVRVLSGHWYIMPLVCILGLLRCMGYAGIVALLLRYSPVTLALEWHWLITTTLSLDLSVDLFITASLCSCLWNMRSYESNRTRTIVEILILWAIESTILTSTASVIQIILFMTRNDLTWAGFFVIQTKLFSNAMLAMLNGRKRFRVPERPNGNIDIDIDIGVESDINFGWPQSQPHRKPEPDTPASTSTISVEV
ncbi:hypothetical protein B0H12DRAFT_770034 [Mycena haematopus]|nr:hypothetical protein B0H12DRAFT_770034 [Mycena haematopus]